MTNESKLSPLVRRKLTKVFGPEGIEDTGLWKVAYSIYSVGLHRFVVRMIGRNNAHDAIQEVYIRLLNRDASMTPNPVGYIFAVARNVCVDLRRNSSRWTLVGAKIPENIPGASVELSGEDIARALIRNDLIREYLSRLPLEQRIAVLRFYRDERTYDEIASELACSPRAVERYLFKARALLRTIIADHSEEGDI